MMSPGSGTWQAMVNPQTGVLRTFIGSDFAKG